MTPFASGVRPSGGVGWDGEGEDDGVPMRLLEALEAGADAVEGGAGSGTSLEATCQYRSKSSRGGRAAGSGLPERAERHQRERDPLCTTASQRLSCCSLRKFMTRFVLPQRT